MRGTPAVLSPHGSLYRAEICNDACESCGPVRERRRAWTRRRAKRETEASHEGEATEERDA